MQILDKDDLYSISGNGVVHGGRFKALAVVVAMIIVSWTLERVDSGLWRRIKFDALTTADVLHLFALLITIIIAAGAAGAYLRSPRRVDYPMKIAIMATATAIITMLIWLDNDRNSALVFAGIGAASIGWIIQAHGSATLQRRQHTLTVLFEMRQCSHFIEAHRILSRFQPPNSQLSSTKAAELIAAWQRPASYAPTDPLDMKDTLGDQAAP